MRRLFAAELPEDGGDVWLDPEAANHARVLRIAVGDDVVLFDAAGRESVARVLEISGDLVRCKAATPQARKASATRVTLIQALPKGSKIDDIVRMCTELGVSAIHLAVSERSVPRMEGERSSRKAERLSRIAREAARQSDRTGVPEVFAPAPLAEVVARAPASALKILFWETQRGGHLTLQGDAAAGPVDAWILIGPEGGLSPGEVAPLTEAGWKLQSLGETVLRVETAAPVAVALVRDRLGGL